MTILSTNVGSIQNVLVHQTADLAEGLTVTIILLVYMMVREWRLTLVLVASTVAPLAVQGVVGWITEKKTEVLMRQQGKQVIRDAHASFRCAVRRSDNSAVCSRVRWRRSRSARCAR